MARLYNWILLYANTTHNRQLNGYGPSHQRQIHGPLPSIWIMTPPSSLFNPAVYVIHGLTGDWIPSSSIVETNAGPRQIHDTAA